MGWLKKSTRTIYYGLEYLYPREEEPDVMFLKDYIFSSDEGRRAVDLFCSVLENFYQTGHDDVIWSAPYEEEIGLGDGITCDVLFSCKEKTCKLISYTMDAYTDGWGYTIQEI